jgi:hypothetical protein
LAGSLLLALSVLSQTVSAEELRWKFAPGEQWKVTLHAETSSTSTLDTKTLKTKLETTVETLWTIDAIDNGVAQITQEITRLSLTGAGVDGAAILYDSAAEDRPTGAAKDIAAAVSPFIGAKVTCRMNSRGEISDVAADATLAKAIGGEKQDSATAGWGLELLQQPLCLLPEKEIAAGGTWRRDRKLNLPLGIFVQQQTFKLAEEANKGRLKITSEATLTPEKEGKSNLRAQEQTGELTFDQESGRLVRSQTTQKLTLATPFRDKEIVVKTQSIRRVEVTREKEAAIGG